jgi:DNA polymerase-1
VLKTWLILDATFLCWRAFYSTGTLSHGDVKTGVLYGFLRDILTFMESHDTERIVFCFDHGPLLRTCDYPGYKANRTAQHTEEQLPLIREMRVQMKLLRVDLLPQLGFKNVFFERGYEADDVIASVCQNLPGDDQGIIIGSDHDLYQLLNDRVLMWNPTTKKAVTATSFTRDYGVSPIQWIDVKAIAGCSGDNVIGIKGVGEKTAAKFLNGSLKSTTKAFEAIVKGNHVWNANRHLVKLPYAGCPSFKLQKDKLNRVVWMDVTEQLGMKSLRNLV